MIQFIECQQAGYPARTRENILNSDSTIAIAQSFDTPGEILTRKLCIDNDKSYWCFKFPEQYSLIAMGHRIDLHRINIAGNGIYSLNVDQKFVDMWVYEFLFRLRQYAQIKSVCSGGQTGVDEAGAKAGIKLGIPTIIRAPKGWMFRDKNHKTITSEKQFKARFNT